MRDPIPRFSVERVQDCAPDIGLWLGILRDARKRTQYALRLLQPEDLDAPPAVGINTIGTILYHMALSDLNWVYDNWLQQPYPEDVAPLFPYPLLDEQDHLYRVTGWTLDMYQQRLDAARAKVEEVFISLTEMELVEVLRRAQSFGVYEMTPESVLQHLTQHEAEHRGEFQLLAQVEL